MKSSDSTMHIVIVGGGAAAWLTANHLACALKSVGDSKVKITLVESPSIPTIGVGEGTVPSIRDSLAYFGISETDLIQKCDATFKQSIEFVGWQSHQKNAKQHRYHHIFDYPRIDSMDAIVDWVSEGYRLESFASTFSIQSDIIDEGLSPKKFSQAEYDGVTSYAYHFDAGKFGTLLAENAVQKLGVKHRKLDVTDIRANDEGGIASLLTDTGESIEADLFVDCTGARSLLLGDFLNVPFISKKDMLFTDTALATQVPNTSLDSPIACSTIATAHQSGWIWDIGLSTRRGVGLVYSSSHMSEEQAMEELAGYLNTSELTQVKKINMKSGYHETFWQGNCVAIGMSQGFVEPLEATGLLMFDKSAQLLSELIAKQITEQQSFIPSSLAPHFNTTLRDVWDGVFDFIKLHYCLSTRSDSQFWRDHQDLSSCSENLATQLERWRTNLPQQSDFSSRPGVFNLANYLYVLFGMDVRPELPSFRNGSKEQTLSAKHHFAMQQDLSALKPDLLSHRALLTRIQKHGLHRI